MLKIFKNHIWNNRFKKYLGCDQVYIKDTREFLTRNKLFIKHLIEIEIWTFKNQTYYIH